VQTAIDAALDRGKLWFPAHLALGGILEGEIEEYLRTAAPSPAGQVTVNFENRWYTITTRLSGWARAHPPQMMDAGADFTVVRLARSGLGAQTVRAANDVLAVDLSWDALPAQDMRVSLRLEDAVGLVWAQRDYAPLGSWPRAGVARETTDLVGLLIPPGVPPGFYRLMVGVGPAGEEWLLSVRGSDGFSDAALVGIVQVVPPAGPLPGLRLPVQVELDIPIIRQGIEFLGASGFDPGVATLAGAEMNVSVFVQIPRPPSAPWELYVSLLDEKGDGVAGWEGWPLPEYPPMRWVRGTQTRLPVRFYLPAGLSPGEYQLVAGVRDPDTGQKGVPVRLGTLPIVRRAASFVSPQPQHPLAQPALFGSHATLLGYDTATAQNGTIDLTLYWQVEQTLLPPHHVFVHLRDGSESLLDQDDGVPGRKQTAAPSNTWLPGEYLTDPHTLAGTSGQMTALVGLYEPVSGVRLPVSVNGEIVGDAYPISLEIP